MGGRREPRRIRVRDRCARRDRSTENVACSVGSPALQRSDVAALVPVLAAEPVPVGGHQHLGLELPQSVQRCLGRVVLTTGAPDRADGAVPRNAITASGMLGR